MTVIAQEIMAEVENLPVEKQQEVLKFVKTLQPAKTVATLKAEPARLPQTIEGLWADLDINITDDDIRELRREMRANFPRYISL